MSNEFDFVVVGAGSGGCAVAGRLSEDPHTSVALLDAGHRVVWRTVGELTDTLFQALELEVAKLNGGP